MLFNFAHKHAAGCLSAGLGFCLEIGYTGKRFSL